jgi:hypothetical protein
MNFPHEKVIAIVVLSTVVGGILRSLIARDKDKDSKVSFDDLLLDPDGRMSKSAVVMYGSFLMTTWMMIYLTMTGKVTETYFGIYGAFWITPSVTKLIGMIKNASPAETH